MDNNDRIVLKLEDGEYETTSTKKYDGRKKYEAGNDDYVVSAIPGTIVEICVSEGQNVKKGDMLCVLDSMKMNNRIVSPRDGIVKEILVKVGENVGKNVRMIELRG